MKLEAVPDGCLNARHFLNDRSLCPRWRLCPGCEKQRAKRNQYKLAKRLEFDLEWAKESGLDLEVGVLSLTLPGKEHEIRSASLGDQYSYLTERRTMSGYTGWHSMRGLNTKLKEWGATGGSHHIEFTNKTGNQWNTHLHSLVVGFKGELRVPLKETTSHVEWNDDLTMKLQSEKLENKTRSNKRILEPLGLGRLYTWDIASEDELASIARYSAKVEYVTKPVKVPEGKLPEVTTFLNGVVSSKVKTFRDDQGRIFSNNQWTRKLPRLSRPFGDWMRNGPERRYAL